MALQKHIPKIPKGCNARARAVFQKKVWAEYRARGRHNLPWRKTHDPYRILVSEVMLQQTQVVRAIPFYKKFLKQFPNMRALARAPLGDVLRIWQGLGYSRRAKFLHSAAQEIVEKYGGRVPSEEATLLALPGVGVYTAGALRVLAFGEGNIPIETNIRTALFYHFFPNRKKVSDMELNALLKKMKSRNTREWFLALMDYGASLKVRGVRRNTQSAHHTPQKPFRGSHREVRGRILRALVGKPHSQSMLLCTLSAFTRERVLSALTALQKEHLISRKRDTFFLGEG